MNVGITCSMFSGCANVLLFSIKDLNCINLFSFDGVWNREKMVHANMFIYSRIYVLNP